MKLLSPQNTTDKSNATLELLRAQEITKQVDKLRKDLATAEADFKNTLARNRELWAQEEQEHQELVKLRTQEVQTLETKRKHALEPVTVLEAKTKAELERLEALATELEAKQAVTEDLQETLENKLDELGAREADLTHKSQVLEAKEMGVALQAEQVRQAVKQLNFNNTSLLANTAKVNGEVEKRKTDLALLETNILVRGTQLKDRANKLTDWALNIKEAELAVAEQKKELLRPVAEIIEEAKVDREQARKELKLAQTDREDAQTLKLQTKQDYQLKLSELEARLEEVAKEEAQVKSLRSELQVKAQTLNKRDIELRSGEENLEIRKDILAKEWQATKDYMDDKDKELARQFALVATKDTQAQTALKQSLEVKSEAEHLFSEARTKEINNKNQHLRLKEQQKALTGLIEQEHQAKKDAAEALSELNLERENFALWRLEAEKSVADHALANKTLRKLLAQKEEKLKRQEKFLANLDKKLKDDQGRLARAWKEISPK